MTEEWRGVVNAVLYGLIYAKELNDDEVDRIALEIVADPYFDQTVEEVRAALTIALRSETPLTGGIPQPHGEPEIRDFLTRLARRLDELRPWAERPFRRLRVEKWPEFTNGQIIARIALNHMKVGNRLRKGFELVEGGPILLGALIMRLKSGEELALVAPWDIKIRETRVVSRDDHPAPELLAAFREATGFTEDEVIPLPN